jgi:hypothetical protein
VSSEKWYALPPLNYLKGVGKKKSGLLIKTIADSTVESLIWNKVGRPANMLANPIPYCGYSI